jgi:hypothetical protein
MRLKQYIKYVAVPARVFVATFIILGALTCLQAITVEMTSLFALGRQEPPQGAAQKPSEQEIKLRRIRNSSRECRPDGTIHLVTDWTRNRYSGSQGDEKEGHRQVRDVNDKLLWEGPAQECPYGYIAWGAESLGGRFGSRYVHRLKSVTPDSVRTIEIPVTTGKITRQIWRFLPGAECFVGYETRGPRIGYIGANGFAESKSQVEPFGESRGFHAWCPEGSRNPVALWQTGRSVYQIIFEKREVTRIFSYDASDIEEVRIHNQGARKLCIAELNTSYKPLLYCRTSDGKQHLILSDPVRQITIKPTEDWGLWHNNYCRFAATDEGVFLQRVHVNTGQTPANFKSRKAAEQWYAQYRVKPRTQRFALYRVDDQGQLDLLNEFEWTVPGQKPQIAGRKSVWLKTRYAVSQFSPPLYDILCHALARQIWQTSQTHRHNDIVRDALQGIAELRPEFGVWSLLLAALMTGLAAWHAIPRRTSLAALVFWLVFVALFGVAGLLTYLALNHTCVIKCPACGKTRGLNQPKCNRCSAHLPAPKPGKLDLIFDMQ